VDDVDTLYHAIHAQIGGAYTLEELKRHAFKYLLAQKRFWSDVELRELAETYHDSRKWRYNDHTLVLALSKAVGHSIVVFDEYGVDLFEEQTKGNTRLFLAKSDTRIHGYRMSTYYSATRTDVGEYGRLARSLEHTEATPYRAPYVDLVKEEDINTVLSHCDTYVQQTIDRDNRRKEQHILD
jgi:hypothetical protein